MMLEFDDKSVGTVTIKKNITENDIACIMVGTFEGGSNYWVGLDNKDKPEWEAKPKDEPNSTWATKILLDGGSIKFYSLEGDEDEDWILTLDKLIKGLQLNCEQRPHDCDLEQGDAGTCDCILQYALFGEVVYG